MLVNLSSVLTEQHKPIEVNVPVEMTSFCISKGMFPVVDKDDAYVLVKHVKNKELEIQGNARVVISIPCDRCLENVPTEFELDFVKNIDLDFTKNVDLKETDDVQEDELDEKNYIDGYNLDVEKLLYNEILIGWPMKILCSEDCKGICNTCGQNLNKATCDCEDTSLDPRMSVIRDVFKNFKEV